MKKFGIDDEMAAFIEQYLRRCNHLPTTMTIAQQRDNYAAIVGYFCSPHPLGITTEDTAVLGRLGKIPLRHYYPEAVKHPAQLVFIHGGGFILGSLDSHDDICAELCAQTGCNLVSIDYRLSPEHFHPAHLDDVEDAFEACWSPNIILVGVSAGATLAAALSHRRRSQSRRPAAQVLIYPSLGGDLFDLDSYKTNASTPLLSTDDVHFYRCARCIDERIPVDDPEFYPLVANDFSGLPPTFAFSADIDPLRDDARLYIDKLVAAGVDAYCVNESGLVHDYLRARHKSVRAANSFSRICEAIILLAN